MIILSIDPSLHATGVALVQSVEEWKSVLRTECITVPKKYTESNAIWKMSQVGNDLLEEFFEIDGIQFTPDVVIVEKPRLGGHRNRSLPAKLTAAAAIWLALCSVKFPHAVPCWVDAQTWQSHIFGRGSSSWGRESLKNSSVHLVSTKYGIDLGDDVSDAVLLADYLIAFIGNNDGKLPPQAPYNKKLVVI